MNLKLQTSLVAIGLAIGFGIVVGMMINDDSGSSGATPESPDIGQAKPAGDFPMGNADASGQAAARISELNRLLQDEIRARQALQQKLEALSDRVAALDSASEFDIPSQDFEQAGESLDDLRPEQGWFDQQALLDSGMDNALVSELKLTFEQLEMERLYLRDRAAREDWDRDKTRSEMDVLESREDELRERLGESAYDAYLYASGQTNRVAVTSVLASAQAGQAGIRSGDHILRYDNQRIYNWMDLRSATTSGDISDTVQVEVERDGETLEFYLARGPLGIRMDSLRVAP